MTNITIYSREIRTLDGLYCLNDLHRAAGGKDAEAPNRFMRLKQTQELIKEIDQTPDMALALKTMQGGKTPGTYVCKELVYAYAMWISPKFHLHVIRAFDQMQGKPGIECDYPIEPLDLKAARILSYVDHEGQQRNQLIKNDQFVGSFAELPDMLHASMGVTVDELVAIQNECTQLLAARARFETKKRLAK